MNNTKHTSNLRSTTLSIYSNRIANVFVSILKWVLIIINIYLIWLIVQFVFSNISSPPPKPTGFDAELSQVSLFYILALSLAGPIMLFVTYFLWSIFWFTLYGPIESFLHHFYRPIIKPSIAICLTFFVLQSVHVFAHGFWYSYFWVGQQFHNAGEHQTSR
jgi:hypothetical protein